MTAQARGRVLEHIDARPHFHDLDVALAIEAATEDFDTKIDLFRRLDENTAPDTILATNTSSMSITSLGAATSKPERVIGMHFMNPVPVMALVEVIRGIATSDATAREVVELATSLGKTPVESRDFPGFIANRILMPMINEAIFAVYEGVASIDAIDTVMKLGMNHPMGPLTLADFIGLDTCLAIMNVLYDGFGDSKYRACPLLKQYVAAGWLGKKSGRGFYDYRGTVSVPAVV
jgi:3-hydroxybutyryl-CoA dehydrogenase